MKAFFVSRPRTYRDLLALHPLDAEQSYEIVITVELKAIDYENFAEDLLADRQFIEDYAQLCTGGTQLRCLLVRRRGQSDGILVVPDGGAHVRMAAYRKVSG